MFGNFEEDRPQDQDHGGFHICQVDKIHLHWAIRTLDGSKLPKRLEGVWTHLDKAMREIDAVVEMTAKEKA